MQDCFPRVGLGSDARHCLSEHGHANRREGRRVGRLGVWKVDVETAVVDTQWANVAVEVPFRS